MADKPKTNKSWGKIILTVMGILTWVGASVIASQLIVGYLMIWIVGSETFSTPVATTIFSALSYIVAMILVIIVLPYLLMKINDKKTPKTKAAKSSNTKRKLIDREALGLRGWPTWSDVGLAPVGFIAQLILSMLLVGLFSLIFPWFNLEEAQDVGYNVLNGGFDRMVAFVSLVIIAPIAEEIIFRGWLYGKLRQIFSGQTTEIVGMGLSIFLVSLLFGLVHMQWNVGVNVFAVSVVLCGLREITGTIYSGILVHMLKNGVAFYFLYVAGVN